MERASSHRQSSYPSTNRPFFPRTPDVMQTAAFFSDYRSGGIQRQAESLQLPGEKDEEQVLQQKLLETTVQRMCAECKQEQRKNLPVQPKLSVGGAGNQYEQEADSVADQVVDHLQTGKATSIQTKFEPASPTITPLVMRQGDGAAAASPHIEQGIQRTRGSGETMEPSVRRSMELAIGADFSGVRIHTSGEADSLNRSLNARAFTTGQDIFFKSGEYQPETPAGQKLLAHELTHVVQQGGAANGGGSVPQLIDRSASIIQRAVTKGCVAPSFVVSPGIASLFGTVAEGLIEPDYISQKGGVPFGNVFLDNPLGPMSYVAFLAAHHPHLNRALLATQIGLSGGILVPDVLDVRDHQLYEIKPDSVDGRLAGRGKLAAIDAFMSFNTLPYVRGTTYTPTPSIPIPLASAALAPFLGLPTLLACGIPNVSLSVTRPAPGLVLYEICVEADFDCWLKVMTLELMIALIILAILVSRGIPLPAPGPAPVPVIAGGPGDGAPLGEEASPGSAVAQTNQRVRNFAPPVGEGVTV